MFMKPKSILLCVVLLLFAWCLCRFILCFCAQISILLDRCESSVLYVGTAFNRGNISEKCMAWDASWLFAKLKETSVGSLPSQWFGVQMRSLSYLILSYLILSYLILSIYLCLSICPSVCLSFHLSIYPSIHPSIYLSIYDHPSKFKAFWKMSIFMDLLGRNKKKHASHEKKSEVPHFLLNPGCLIGILIIVYDNPHTTG